MNIVEGLSGVGRFGVNHAHRIVEGFHRNANDRMGWIHPEDSRSFLLCLLNDAAAHPNRFVRIATLGAGKRIVTEYWSNPPNYGQISKHAISVSASRALTRSACARRRF